MVIGKDITWLVTEHGHWRGHNMVGYGTWSLERTLHGWLRNMVIGKDITWLVTEHVHWNGHNMVVYGS